MAYRRMIIDHKTTLAIAFYVVVIVFLLIIKKDIIWRYVNYQLIDEKKEI